MTASWTAPGAGHREHLPRPYRTGPDHDQQSGERGHRDVSDDATEQQDHRRHHGAGEEQRQPRARAGRDDQGARRHGPTDRHALEKGRGDVPGALTDEVLRRVRARPARVRHPRGHPRALHQAHERQRQARQEQPGDLRERGEHRQRQRPRHVDDVGEPLHRRTEGAEHHGEPGADHHGDDQPERPQRRALQGQDQRDGDHTDRGRSEIDLSDREQQLQRAGEPSLARCLVTGEVGELAEHDVHADGGDEARHDRRGDEAQQPAEACHSGRDHDEPGDEGEGVQRPFGVRPGTEVDVGHDDGHCAGGLDGHEGRAGEQRAADHPEQVGVQPGHRVDPGEEPAREPVRHTLDTEHHACPRVRTERLAPPGRAELGDRGEQPARPGGRHGPSRRHQSRSLHRPIPVSSSRRRHRP
jgi:hypothetical protein